MKKCALVIGLGISGRGAARLLLLRGYDVIGCDANLEGKEKLKIPLMLDTDPLPDLPFCFVVLSPGISVVHPLCIAARARKIEVIGEAELAFRHLSQPCIGVTGTKWKDNLDFASSPPMQSSRIARMCAGKYWKEFSPLYLQSKRGGNAHC